MRQKKGFIISLDALVALLVFAVMLGSSAFYFGQVRFEAGGSVLLKEVASDALTVLDKTNVLQNAVEEGTGSEIRSFLGRLPYNQCAEVLVYSNADLGNASLSVLRQGCEKTFGELATVKRSFFVESNGNLGFYIAVLKMWTRETK